MSIARSSSRRQPPSISSPASAGASMLPSYVDLRPWPPGKVRSCCSLAATTVTASAARYRLFTEVASCANFSITWLQPVKGSLQNPRAWRGLGFPLTGLPGWHPRIRDLGILFYEHSRKHARTSARAVSKMFRALPAATPAAQDRRPQGFGRRPGRCRVKEGDRQGAHRLHQRCCLPRSAQARRRAHRSQRRTSRCGDTRANTAATVKTESEACFAFTRAARPCTEAVIADRPQGGSCRAPQGEGAA